MLKVIEGNDVVTHCGDRFHVGKGLDMAPFENNTFRPRGTYN